MKRLLVLAGLAVFLAGCGNSPKAEAEHHEEEEHSENTLTLDEEQQRLAGIETEPAAMRVIYSSLSVSGIVKSTTKGRAVVTPPVAGRVVKINVELSDLVAQGQELGVIESVDLAETWSSISAAERNRDEAIAALKEARAEIGLANAKLASARINLSRQMEFVKVGAFSQAPLQAAQNELNEAQSDLLSVQKEQASHADVVRRLENLYRDGIVSKSELEAARLELQQDEIRHNRASARIAIAKATYEREKNIATRGLLNAKELQTAEADVRASQLEVDRSKIRAQSAEASVVNARRAVDNARSVYRSSSAGAASGGRVSVRSPISGVVTQLSMTLGQAVDRVQTLAEVENLAAVWVTANVPENESQRIRKGSRVTVQVDSLKSVEFSGVVQVVGGSVDPKTRTIPVQCLVEARGQLTPGMFATVIVSYGPTTNTLAVSSSAIVTEEGESFVFVQDGESFEKVPVTLGTSAQGWVPVLSGLKEGAQVVKKGSFVLSSQLKKGDLKGHDH